MIDFSCCEVKKAIGTLYSDNTVLSIKPIVKTVNSPFTNDAHIAYYGMFSNAGANQTIKYRGNVVDSDGPVIFNYVDTPEYSFFQGYEIKLGNVLEDTLKPVVIFNFIIHESFMGNPDFITLQTTEENPENVAIKNGHQILLEDWPQPHLYAFLDYNDNVFVIGNSGPLGGHNFTEADFIQDGDNFRIDLTFYHLEYFL